jgi:DNA modification methylase
VTTPSTAWGSWCSPQNPILRATSEPIWVFDKGTRQHLPRDGATSDLTRAEFMTWTRNTWFITAVHADRSIGHPAMFPLELPRRVIRLYSFVGDTILDPFCGSGTTLRAAKNLGRIGLGVEQSERYCRLAAGRCAQAILPLQEEVPMG